ncbi:MAG: hypothetical protein U0Z53_00365 [Blastocatellia bacterium]
MSSKPEDIFFVGGYFRDRKQGYTVAQITDSGITIRTDDGKIITLDKSATLLKAQIYKNIISEYRNKHPVLTHSYFRSLGFLSKNARFEAELPKKAVTGFLTTYSNLTGEHINVNHIGISLLGDVDKWGAELRIYFSTPGFEPDLGPGIDVRAGQSPDIWRINNNSLWQRLVAVGFRLGNSHDIQKIKETVPAEMMNSFMQGQS